MKSRKMIVPRMLIKHHSLHPETYGESVVCLINNMTTDVYTSENGDLFTMTNHTGLIKYLKHNQMPDLKMTLCQDSVRLRSIDFNDTEQLLLWMNHTSITDDSLKYTFDDIRNFISHGISSQSHLFIVEVDQIPMGTVGYDVIDGVALNVLKIYEKSFIQENHTIIILDLVKNYIRSNYQISNFDHSEIHC